jgi:phosphatidylinositol alpha-1,6-mannosyltransferase
MPEAELPAYYHLCDLFAMTSRQVRGQPVEGLGLVYLEANACGKPVLGADTGGVSDAIEQEENGLLIAPGDIPSCAAAAIKILGNPEYAAAMGQRGRERVEREFLWRHVAERFMRALTSRA